MLVDDVADGGDDDDGDARVGLGEAGEGRADEDAKDVGHGRFVGFEAWVVEVEVAGCEEGVLDVEEGAD